MKNNKIYRIVLIALMSACCYVAFRFLKIRAPFTIHLGNVFCLLAALLLGGVEGGICGAIGMGIGDLLDPQYITTFPKTVVCKMIMAITAGYLAKNVFKVNETKSKQDLFAVLLISILINIVFELAFGYLYYRFLLHTVNDTFNIYLSTKLVSVSVTSMISLLVTFIIYFPLYNRIKSYL